jgi:hypothetical protein
LDYSQRSNKLAHHVILESAELPDGGPAWSLSQPGFLEDRWDGEVRFLPKGRVPLQGDAAQFAPSVCRHWQELTGDGGWAGVLADSFEKDTQRQVYLIFAPGMDLLPLVVEALGLLPTRKRWLVTFSTYFTNLPQGIPCLWRFVLKDSPEAANAGRLPGQEVINLCEPLGKPASSELVEFARTGRKPLNAASRTEKPEVSADWPGNIARDFHPKETESTSDDSQGYYRIEGDQRRPSSAKAAPPPMRPKLQKTKPRLM